MARRIGDKEERPVLPWRLVVGIFLHFAVPLYLIALLAAFLFLPNVPAGAEARIRWMLHESALFVIGFIAATIMAGIVTAMLDPMLRRLRRRRQSRDPNRSAIASDDRARVALARIEAADWGKANVRVAAAVARLRRDPWDHGDQAGQRLSMDLWKPQMPSFRRSPARAHRSVPNWRISPPTRLTGSPTRWSSRPPKRAGWTKATPARSPG